VNDAALIEIAETVGIAPAWHDFRGQLHEVTPESLRAVLAAMGVPTSSDDDLADALQTARAAREKLPPLVSVRVGEPLQLHGHWSVELERGGRREGDNELRIDELGYHRLTTEAGSATLAVAPQRCHPLPPGRPWGIAAQLYGLRRNGDGGIGDFGALRDFVASAARHGADAVAISPVHAQFSADPDRFSPYAPSSRIMLNVLHAESEGDAELERAALVDWPRAARARLAEFRRRFEAGIDEAALAGFRAASGEALERHARFEALHRHFYGSDPAKWDWRSWPAPYRDPNSTEVAGFAGGHAREVAFHAWLQFLADQGMARAQEAARAAGMRIGLISDLAIGADGGGSHAWSRQGEMMTGLSVGAPPDLLNAQGQNWGISAFSPLGLRQHGFGAFIEMLRAALRNAGGVRIDHAMGLQRLWVVPDGADAHQGAYLQFPLDDMLRLLALESQRHQAVVLGEDLGTLPDGFQERLIAAGVLGMRVLWFERDDAHFWPPAHWSVQSVAMTSTHDLVTVAGWWRGRDIEWRQRLGWLPDAANDFAERDRDRGLLWQAMRDSGSASGDPPPPHDTFPAVDAALAHVGRSACELVLLPLEDVLAEDEQPNFPGTTTQHPNWQRRLPVADEQPLDLPVVAERLQKFRGAREG
jgi:4-alpha-glucanotransferase